MRFPETVSATSGGRTETFEIDWFKHRWTSAATFEMSDFPFVAMVAEKRYELYGDGTFDEEEEKPDAR